MGLQDYVTVEPAMFLQMAGDTLTFVIYQNLFIEKICRTELNYSKESCDIYASTVENNETTSIEFDIMVTKIQQSSSNFVLYNSLVENFFPVLLVLFLGVWSDENRKRKPPLILALIGKLLRSFGFLLNSYFISWPLIFLLLMGALPHSFGGGNAVFHMAAFSYISDSSAPRSRTWRLGLAEACWHLGSPVGYTLGAYLFEKGGYMYVFGTSALCHLVSVLYTGFLLPEVPQPKPPRFKIGKHGWYGTWRKSLTPSPRYQRIRYYSENDCFENIQKTIKKNPTLFPSQEEPEGDSAEDYSLIVEVGSNRDEENNEKNFLLPPMTYKTYSDIVNEEEEDISVLEFIIGSIRSIVKKRANHTRACLLSLGLIIFLYALSFHGEINMKYLFTRNKFGWRELEFSRWVIFESLLIVGGLVVIMPICSKLLRLSDPFSGALAAITRFASRGFYGLGTTSKDLYIGSIIDINGVIGPLSARSLASKCVMSKERGKVFAFFGCIEALVPLIAVPLYSLIYSSTLAKDPSTIYYLSCAIYLVIFITFSILFIAMKLKIVQFSGTDTSALTNPVVETLIRIPGTNTPHYYRRTSLS